MPQLTMLGRKGNLRSRELPGGFRFSLGPISNEEHDYLLRAAFDIPDAVWTPSENLIAVPSVRRATSHADGGPPGDLVAACSVLRPCFVHQFVVNPDYHRMGIGTALLAWIAETFELPYLLLQTDFSTTPGGHAFWKALGFAEVGS